jgi:hypothetical protein
MYSLIGGIELKIANLQFDKVINCSIDKTTRLLSNVATIELPLSAVFENTRRLSLPNEIKRGDKVSIKLGYDAELVHEFEGFVLDVSDNDKTIIKCEDSMYLFRKPVDNKLFKKTKLKDILTYVVSGSGIQLNSDIPEIEFDSFLLKNVTAIQALQKIKDNYGLLIYLDNSGALFCGLSYQYDAGNVTYNLQEKLIDNKLEYKESEDLKFRIKAVSLLKNNTRLEIETGDEDGDQRTLYFRNIKDKVKLTELAKQEIEKYKYTGYRGSLTGFGLPYATFGMKATIKDSNYPAREGDYYIEGVNVKFGQDGFSRKCELGVKL